MSTNSTSFYINLAGNVTAQASRFGQSIQRMTNRAKTALVGMKGAVTSASASLDKIGNRAFLGITAGGVLAARSIIKTAADFEMAGIRMRQTFGKDGDKANAWLKQFATDTPMAFGDVQDAMMRLKTAGIDPMNGSLQALVDYNAKVGGNAENLNGYISAISKGFIKGKLSMEEINPLLERNVKVFEILAAETGGKYTAAQMQKMLQQGKLGRESIKALLHGMGKDAAGAAKEQMKTWNGLVSNLEDIFISMQARFMEKGVFDELKTELGGILDWLNAKIDSGEFDEFAKQVSDTLVQALRDLKDISKEIKPSLESIGNVITWLTEKAGGYGNLAKFAAALYAANKLARSNLGQGLGKGALSIGKGAWGVTKWVAGKRFGKKTKGGSAHGIPQGISNTSQALGNMAGATPVFVTNFADLGYSLGANTQPSKKHKKQNRQPRTKTQRATQNARNRAKQLSHRANAISNTVTNSIKQTATQALKSTTTTAKSIASSVTKTVSKTASKAVPFLNTALTIAEGASVLMDDNATTQEKSESIGSMAGATAGAIIGQALIPVPMVGAAIGGMIGDWLGSWLGSEVGEKLASPEPQETKLEGAIEVKIKPSEGLIASVNHNQLKTNRPNDSLQLATTMGYSGRALYGGN